MKTSFFHNLIISALKTLLQYRE